MDRAVEAPDELGPVHDTETWSGSESHAESYCSQDKAYYGGAENELQEGEQFPHIPNALLGWKLRDHQSTEDSELSLSNYSQEGDPPGPLRYSPAPHHDVLSGSQVDSCPCTGSEDEDSGIPYSKPLLVSESIARNLTCREPPASGSSCPDQAVTLPRPGKQSPLECSDSLESEEEGKEEGGGNAAPPAPHVSGGIQTQGAERTELWEPASLNRPDRARRHRERHTRLRRSEGESEKHLKEVQSKCKCIALLLTAAPDPESKGVLMFKKRRQRARKFTLVSYGTGKPVDNSSKNEYSFAGEGIDQNFRFSSPTTSASEIEEDSILEVENQGTALNITYNYNPLVGGVSANHNWETMEQLPQTKGKGVLMFAKRRQRIDEIAAEHEEMRRKGIPVESFSEHEFIEPMPVAQQGPALIEQDVQVKQQVQYQEQHYQLPQDYQPNTGVNGLDPCSSMSKSLVPNRTAKPFLGGLNQVPKPFSPVKGVPSPTLKKPETIFKVPIPVNTSPQVWSPTGDIIASRDERIAVPAIKTGILPEIKRRGANKSDSREPQEEDHLSLGAEACNFMQVPTVKQKNPPPILPKPAINPACPPWSTEGHAPRSPLTPISPVQAYSALPQQKWAPPKPQPQSSKKPWAPSPSQPVQQQNMPAWLPSSQSTSYQATWTSEPQHAPMSIQTPTVSHAAPPQSKVPWTKPQYQAHSVASCPPQHGSSYFHSPKAPAVSPRGQASETEFSDGPVLKGKGAELFARRQTRMEKFVVDTETVQANKARPSSPTLSVPSTWKYSPNIRAPPPVSYNPIVSPFYPLAAQKQPPPATSPKIRSQANKEQPKPKAKHLSVVDVMKHQPYQLDSSLFTYNYTPEMKAASPKLSPVPPPESKQSPIHTPNYLQSQSSGRFPSPALPPSPVLSTGSAQLFRPGLPVTPGGPVYSRSRSMSLPRGHSSVSTLSPVSSPSFHSAHRMPDRQMSWVERPETPLSPWETTARSTLGIVDEVYGSGHRKSLPEASLERKPQMSSNLAGRPQAIPPAMVGPPLTKASFPASGKTVTYGPPFRPAQPLPGDRYIRTSSLPRNFSPLYTQMYRVGWKE